MITELIPNVQYIHAPQGGTAPPLCFWYVLQLSMYVLDVSELSFFEHCRMNLQTQLGRFDCAFIGSNKCLFVRFMD